MPIFLDSYHVSVVSVFYSIVHSCKIIIEIVVKVVLIVLSGHVTLPVAHHLLLHLSVYLLVKGILHAGLNFVFLLIVVLVIVATCYLIFYDLLVLAPAVVFHGAIVGLLGEIDNFIIYEAGIARFQLLRYEVFVHGPLVGGQLLVIKLIQVLAF